jgi:hypothetical protein
MITNMEAGTRVDEVAAGIYRISTPRNVIPGGDFGAPRGSFSVDARLPARERVSRGRRGAAP